MEWMILPLKHYADFSGRSRRKEFWMFFLFQFLMMFGFLIPATIYIWISANSFGSDIGGSEGLGFLVIPIFWALFVLATLVPNMAIVVRRFHDQGISGIVGILLYVGTMLLSFPGLIILIFMCFEGNKGENQYGDDPKLNEKIGDVFR